MSFNIVAARQWTYSTVLAEILAEYRAGQDLCYSRTEERSPSLLHAAVRIFGSWANAVNTAGLDYNAIRRYQRWTRERIIERIGELHRAGIDLSWRNISTIADPALAAAALRCGRFDSWGDALRAAGINPDQVARHRRWSLPKIREELRRLHRQGVSLDRDTLNRRAPALLAAVYRVGDGLVVERQKMTERVPTPASLSQERTERERVVNTTRRYEFERMID